MENKINETLEYPLVSIIVTFYNQEKYIPSCLELLIKQSYKNIEIICVNDASTDSSQKFLDYYQKLDSRIKVINNSENLERVKSRKIGFENSKGDFVTFVDGDDYLYPGAIKIFIDAYNKYQTPDFPIGVIGSEFEIVPANSVTYRQFRDYFRLINPLNFTLKSDQTILSSRLIDNYIDKNIHVTMYAKLIKRRLVEKSFSLTDDRISLHEDVEFNFFLAKIMTEQNLNFVKINKLLYYRRYGSPGGFNYLENFQIRCRNFVQISKNFIKWHKTDQEFPSIQEFINIIHLSILFKIDTTPVPEKYQMQEIYLDQVSDFVINNKIYFNQNSIDWIKKVFS